MNLDQAKKQIYKELNVFHKFCYYGNRNQNEEFEGTIIKTFPSVFIIKLVDGSIKSFSYNDFIISCIKIIY